MKSKNFEILRDRWPELASLGGFAEQYAHPDPSSALVKLRSLIENMVWEVYRELGITNPPQPTTNDLLNWSAFRTSVPTAVVNKLHLIRKAGNKAAHGEKATHPQALAMLREAFDLARWFFCHLR